MTGAGAEAKYTRQAPALTVSKSKKDPKKEKSWMAVALHTFNPNTQEAEADESLCVSQPGLQKVFQDS